MSLVQSRSGRPVGKQVGMAVSWSNLTYNVGSGTDLAHGLSSADPSSTAHGNKEPSSSPQHKEQLRDNINHVGVSQLREQKLSPAPVFVLLLD